VEVPEMCGQMPSGSVAFKYHTMKPSNKSDLSEALGKAVMMIFEDFLISNKRRLHSIQALQIPKSQEIQASQNQLYLPISS